MKRGDINKKLILDYQEYLPLTPQILQEPALQQENQLELYGIA
jgi:hypothetical protein